MNPQILLVISFGSLLSYLIGSIPFGLLLGNIFGAGDIRKIGSGNIGATNMLRTGRKGLAAATLVLDFTKGILGIVVAQCVCNMFYAFQSGDIVKPPSVAYEAGVAAVLGHIFPIWLQFKGGKGVATTLGVFLATQPLIGVLVIMGWIMVFYLSRVSSLAAVISIAGSPILSYLYANTECTVMAFILAVLVIYKHKDNLRRLREGTETKVEKKENDAA
jgi:glycerol-3-phosphate acyltransferase PlsY